MFLTKPNLSNRPMNIQFCIDHNDVPFFQYWSYSTRSTKVLLRYVVMYVKIYIWAKWDLGTLGGNIRFLQIYTDFVQNWLNIIDWHSLLYNIEVSSYGHKYLRSCFLSSSKIVVKGYILYPTSPQKILCHL